MPRGCAAVGLRTTSDWTSVLRRSDLFKDCFSDWVATLREEEPDIIAIDGKTARRSHDRSRGREPLHMVSAWASRQHLVLGQEAVADKSNEIVAIPRLLERLELKGALVTIDAMGTQSAIAEAIVAKGGDYLLALKANRPAIYDDVARFFADPLADMVSAPFETVGKDHGRIEVRRHRVCHEVDWLFSDRRYPDEPRSPHLAMIAMVETQVERGEVPGTTHNVDTSSILECRVAISEPGPQYTPAVAPPPEGSDLIEERAFF